MTGHSPESNAGRIPENVDNKEHNEGDDGFRDVVTERYSLETFTEKHY